MIKPARYWRKEEWQIGLLTALGAAFLLLFCLLPFAYMLAVAWAENHDFLSPQVDFRWTFANFREIAVPELHVPAYLANSLGIAGATALGATVFAGLAAFALTRLRVKGGRGILLAALALSMFPPISIAGYLFRMMAELGWINTYPALILPYIAWILPLCLWFLAGFFQGIPRELDKAAWVDGCTPWQLLRHILLPLARPGLLSAALLAFIFAYNEFLFALLLTVDAHSRTLPVGIAMFQGLHGEVPWGSLMAASVLAVLPVVLLALVFQKQIVGGLTRGAVKG